MEKEKLVYSDYLQTFCKSSKYLPGKYINYYMFTCPSCDKLQQELDHGETIQCSCGLFLQVFGNALYIWRE